MRNVLCVVMAMLFLIVPSASIAGQPNLSRWGAVPQWRVDYSFSMKRSGTEGCGTSFNRSETLTGSGLLKRTIDANPLGMVVWKDKRAVQSGKAQKTSVTNCSDPPDCNDASTESGTASGTLPSVIRLAIYPTEGTYNVRITVKKQFYGNLIHRAQFMNRIGVCVTYTTVYKKNVQGGRYIDIGGPLPTSGRALSGTAPLDTNNGVFSIDPPRSPDTHEILHWSITPVP